MQTGIIWLCIAGFLSGITASMGLGGGFVLLIYLTFFTPIAQLESQLMNLIFFIPISLLSILLHLKNHLIETKVLFKSILMGIIGVILGSFLSELIAENMLSKLFGGLILLVGFKELFHKKKPVPKSVHPKQVG